MALIEKLTAIADAIRGKTGGTEGMTLEAMVSAIEGIEAGGGGGLPAGITEIQTGSWTQATNDSSGSFTIPHGCSRTPRFIIVNSDYATSGASVSNSVQLVAATYGDDGNISGSGQLAGGSSGTGGNLTWDNVNMTFFNYTARRWRQGNTYTWYAICVDNWGDL